MTIQRLRELEESAKRAAIEIKNESDNNMCALYQSQIVSFNKAIDVAAPALLKLAEAAQEVACTEGEDIKGLKYLILQVDRKAWAELKAALKEVE